MRALQDTNQKLSKGPRIQPSRACKRPKQREVQSWTTGKLVVGSLDVVAMYPSITHEQAVGSVYRAALRSKLKFQGLDHDEIGKYIAIKTKSEERNKFKECLPQRHSEGQGRQPDVGYLETNKGQNKRLKWRPAQRQATETEKRELWAWALSLMVGDCIKNHIYSKNNTTYIQVEGLPIGNIISGELAQTVMIEFDEEYSKKCRDLGIPDEQYKRYVDDELKVTYEIKPGVRYRDNKLVMDTSKVEDDMVVPGDLGHSKY